MAELAPSIIETVPNVSTADPAIVARLATALCRPPHVRLIHVTSDSRHGRTVFTAIGDPAAVADALVELGRRAASEIDLRSHHGLHPRVGALDVVPLVPLVPALPARELAGIARSVAERLAREAGVVAVAYAAADPSGRQLPDLRQGGPVELLRRIDGGDVPAWLPPGDSPALRARAGVACVGARDILVAFNVELRTGDAEHARRFARALRERHGGLPAVRALGFQLGVDRVQVSMNLLDYRRTPVLAAYEAVERLAAAASVTIVRSELIGCVPRAAWPEGLAERVHDPAMTQDVEERRILESWLPGGRHADDPGLSGTDVTPPTPPPEGDGEVIPATALGGDPMIEPAKPPRTSSPDPRMRLLDLPGHSAREALEAVMMELGEDAYRARQVLHAVYARRMRRFEEMTELPKALRESLNVRLRLGLLTLADRAVAADGTVKYAWLLSDGSEVESVSIPTDSRTTFCVSSQVGCALRCRFCATGYLGLTRNLSAGEIVDQVLAMLEDGRADRDGRPAPGAAANVVFMGMGEPGYNLTAVLQACRTMNDPAGLAIGARHLTISTAGVVPAIRQLMDEPLQVRLAVSLHAGDQELRARLMNIAERHPLGELLEACRDYVARTGRRVTFEYAVMPGVNDSAEDARSLAAFARQVPSKINLIPYNPVAEFGAPAAKERDLESFRHDLRRHYPGEVMIRRTRGRDIEAACGMLHRARQAGGQRVR